MSYKEERAYKNNKREIKIEIETAIKTAIKTAIEVEILIKHKRAWH